MHAHDRPTQSHGSSKKGGLIVAGFEPTKLAQMGLSHPPLTAWVHYQVTLTGIEPASPRENKSRRSAIELQCLLVYCAAPRSYITPKQPAPNVLRIFPRGLVNNKKVG